MTTDLRRLLRVILAVVALSSGLVVLLSFALDIPPLTLLRGLFVEWTVIVIAFAMLLGVVNVVRVHGKRIRERDGTLYSVVTLLAFLVVFVPGILSPDLVPDKLQGLVGPSGRVVQFVYQFVQRPLQATLFSLLAFFVATAAWRAFRIRSAASLTMLVAAVVVLLGSIKLSAGSGWRLLTEAKEWILGVPSMAGARGILLGIALATIVAGVRLLTGVERPYSD